MRKGKRTAIWILCFCLCCFVFSGALAEEKKQAGITILVYMCGSDLESSFSSATQDIQEMIQSKAGGSEVSILVLLGGTERWASGYGADRLTMLEINGGKGRIVTEEALRSMGSPDTLQHMISYAQHNYPADEYALIFWDHGSGPMEGLCFDELFRPDRLSIEEITEVLEASGFSEKKLKWIGFDACLMGAVEVAIQLAPYAEYMIASEESEPSCGWDYLFLKGIDKDTSAEETAKRLIDMYVNQNVNEVMTLSCLDLSKVDALVEAVDGIFQQAAGITNPEDYSEIARLRKMILSYGSDVSRGMFDHDLVDMDQLINSIPNLNEETIRSFMQATEQTVVYRNSNIQVDSGISVYFPFYNKNMYAEWIRKYPLTGSGSAYLEYIRQFGGMLMDQPFADWSKLDMKIYLADQNKSIPTGYSLENQTRFGTDPGESGYIESLTPEEAAVESGILARTELTEDQQRDFLSARLLVLERFHTMFSEQSQYRVIYTSPELDMGADGAVRGVYPEVTLHITDENGISLASEVSYSFRENGDLAVQVIARDTFSGKTGKELPLILTFRMDEDGGWNLAETFIFDELTGNYTNRAGYNREEYPYLIFPYQYICPESDVDGNRLNYVQWTESQDYNRETVIANDGRWHPEFRDASGNYALALCMEITDTQNNRHISAFRTVDWGYGSRDLIYENPNLRVIAENIQTDGEQIRLNMTLISSDLADFELAVYDVSVNGKQADVITRPGEQAPCSGYIHLSKGKAFTHTIAFTKVTQEPLSALAFRFAVYYDESSESEIRRLENGTSYVFWDEGENAFFSGTTGPGWYFTDKVFINLSADSMNSQEVFATDEMTVQGGHIHYGDYFHQAELGSASLLKTGLGGEIRFSRAELPEEEENVTLYIGELHREAEEYVLEIRQKCIGETDGNAPRTFQVSERNLQLGSGTETRPVTLVFRDGKAVVEDLRFFGETGNAGPRVSLAEIGENTVIRVLTEDGEEPAELVRTARWNTLQARWTEDGKIQLLETPQELEMVSPLLTVQTEDQMPAEETVLIVDESGRILKICGIQDLMLESVPGTPEDFTTVNVKNVLEGTEEVYCQTDEWIWKTDGQSVNLIRYTGADPDVVVPERLGGLPLGSIQSGVFTETQAYNITLPSYPLNIDFYAFTKYSESQNRTTPDKGTLTIPSDIELNPEVRKSVHIEMGFTRCITRTDESFWEPPLICLKTQENELEILGASGREESLKIPEVLHGFPVTAIGDSAFKTSSLASNLKFISIPEGIQRIGENAFKGSKIREITLPRSLEGIGSGALDSCNQLREVHIRCNLNLIEKDFFAKCALLNRDPYRITLPDEATEEEVDTFMKRVFPNLERPLQREKEQEE